MSKHNRDIAIATTKSGHQLKVRIDKRDNTALPTNWKHQSTILAVQGKLTKKDGKAAKRA